MIATAHVTAGMIASIAALSVRGNGLRVATALVLGVVSHFALDIIPHSDYRSLSRWAILCVITLELLGTFALGWYLLRPRRIPGLRVTLPAGLAGAMFPDIKFASYFLPEPAATRVAELGVRFHEGRHAAPSPLAVGLSAEIACTLLLIAALWLIARRFPLERSLEG